MIPLIAAGICMLLIWELFRLDRDPEPQTSWALWIPTFWLFIASSRNISAWLQYSYSPGGSSDQYTEGSPVDRAVLTLVLALGVIVLLSRARRIGPLLAGNLPVLFYFFYCGFSVFWSDFPDVAFKRWFRALGDVVMVLIVISDPNWLVALRRLFSRVGFVVVPLSILFIRYFPQLGRSYTIGGTGTWTGVGTDKNALGMLCLVFGLATIFRFMELRREPPSPRRKKMLIAHGAVIIMTLYLLYEAHSATALACFFLAGIPMVLTYSFGWARRRGVVHLLIFAMVAVSFTALFLNIGSGMVEELGRDSTLTGRTNIWRSAFGLVRNPIIGTGFESFWVGPRLKAMERLIDQTVNQAHDGYIEVYLNLGWVGVTLLAFILLSAYRRVVRDVSSMSQAASLRLGYLIVALTYNFTEAGFKMMHPVWITLLIAAMVIPEIAVSTEPPPPLGVDLPSLERKPETPRYAVPVGRYLERR